MKYYSFKNKILLEDKQNKPFTNITLTPRDKYIYEAFQKVYKAIKIKFNPKNVEFRNGLIVIPTPGANTGEKIYEYAKNFLRIHYGEDTKLEFESKGNGYTLVLELEFYPRKHLFISLSKREHKT